MTRLLNITSTYDVQLNHIIMTSEPTWQNPTYLHAMFADGEAESGRALRHVLVHAHHSGRVHSQVRGHLGAVDEVFSPQVLHPLQVTVGHLDDGALRKVRGVVQGRGGGGGRVQTRVGVAG